MAKKKQVYSREELDLLDAIHAEPRSDTRRLVYADWLEEHADPLGEYIRLQMKHEDSIICGEEKRHYISDRERELYKVHKRDWMRPVPRHLRPLAFTKVFPMFQFRVDLHVPRFVWLEQLSTAELDGTLEAVNPRVRFAMICCETPHLAKLLKHRFFGRVDILNIVVGPERQRVTGSRLVSPEAVIAVAGCPYLRNFWTVELECKEKDGWANDEMRQTIKNLLPRDLRVATQANIRLSTAMFYKMRRRDRRDDHPS